MIALALYKVRRLLKSELRLRTACDLELKENGLSVTRPQGFKIPEVPALETILKQKIAACKAAGILGAVTEVEWKES